MNPLLAAILMPLSSLASLALASAQIQTKAKTSPATPELPLTKVLPTIP
ncbi:hypothetical protein N9897_00100 [bacterium]|nr:hypothetical protein [bacterium]